MKKLKYLLITIAILIPTIVFSAPTMRYDRTIYPEVTDTYELGTTSKRWLNASIKNLNIDSCTGSGCGSPLNTNPFTATYFTATSTTATSTFFIASIDNLLFNSAIGSQLYAGEVINNPSGGDLLFSIQSGGGDISYDLTNDATSGLSVQLANGSTLRIDQPILSDPNINLAIDNGHFKFNSNIGIYTGSNTPVNPLDVSGGVAIGSSYAGSATAPSNGLVVEGNVGIGTASPTRLLHLAGSSATFLMEDTAGSTDEKKWYFQAGGGALYWGAVDDAESGGQNYARILRSGTSVTQWDLLWALGVGGASVITATPSGVGIMNDSPAYQLDVGTPFLYSENPGQSTFTLAFFPIQKTTVVGQYFDVGTLQDEFFNDDGAGLLISQYDSHIVGTIDYLSGNVDTTSYVSEVIDAIDYYYYDTLARFEGNVIISGQVVGDLRASGSLTTNGNVYNTNYADGRTHFWAPLGAPLTGFVASDISNNWGFGLSGNSSNVYFDATGLIFRTYVGAEIGRFNASNNFGLGTGTTVSARLHTMSTTEQLRVGYNASNYYSTTVGSTGGVTFNAVGSGSAFTFSDPATISSTLNVTGNTTLANASTTNLSVIGDTNVRTINATSTTATSTFATPMRFTNSFTPATTTAPCVTGDETWDTNYIYKCVSTNLWKRTALSLW